MLTAEAQKRLINAAWKNAIKHAPALAELPAGRAVLWRVDETGELALDDDGRVVFAISDHETLHASPDAENAIYLYWDEGKPTAKGRVLRNGKQWGPEMPVDAD